METHQSDDTPGAEKAPAAARILVVDDEQQLLKILTRYLARLGYGVVAASSTEEAWEHIQASPRGYALALIDATMPGMTAEELTTRILRANPAIRDHRLQWVPHYQGRIRVAGPGAGIVSAQAVQPGYAGGDGARAAWGMSFRLKECPLATDL